MENTNGVSSGPSDNKQNPTGSPSLSKVKGFKISKKTALIGFIALGIIIVGGILGYIYWNGEGDSIDKDELSSYLPETGCEAYKSDDGLAKQDAVINGDLVPCLCVEDSDAKSECESETKDVLYSNLAVSGCNVETCDNIQDEEEKIKCQGLVSSKNQNLLEDELGGCALRGGDNVTAMANLEKQLDNYGDPDTLINLASVAAYNALVEEDKRDEYIEYAFGLLDVAEAIDPDNKRLYKTKGYVYRVNEDYENSLASYDKALEIDSDYTAAKIAKAESLYLSGDREAALFIMTFIEQQEWLWIDSYMEYHSKMCLIGFEGNEFMETTIDSCMKVAYAGTEEISADKRRQALEILRELYTEVGRKDEADIYNEMAKAADEEGVLSSINGIERGDGGNNFLKIKGVFALVGESVSTDTSETSDSSEGGGSRSGGSRGGGSGSDNSSSSSSSLTSSDKEEGDDNSTSDEDQKEEEEEEENDDDDDEEDSSDDRNWVGGDEDIVDPFEEKPNAGFVKREYPNGVYNMGGPPVTVTTNISPGEGEISDDAQNAMADMKNGKDPEGTKVESNTNDSGGMDTTITFPDGSTMTTSTTHGEDTMTQTITYPDGTVVTTTVETYDPEDNTSSSDKCQSTACCNGGGYSKGGRCYKDSRCTEACVPAVGSTSGSIPSAISAEECEASHSGSGVYIDGYCYDGGSQGRCEAQAGCTYKFVKNDPYGSCTCDEGTDPPENPTDTTEASPTDVSISVEESCKQSYDEIGVWENGFCYDGRAQGNCESVSGCTFSFVKGDANGQCTCTGEEDPPEDNTTTVPTVVPSVPTPPYDHEQAMRERCQSIIGMTWVDGHCIPQENPTNYDPNYTRTVPPQYTVPYDPESLENVRSMTGIDVLSPGDYGLWPIWSYDYTLYFPQRIDPGNIDGECGAVVRQMHTYYILVPAEYGECVGEVHSTAMLQAPVYRERYCNIECVSSEEDPDDVYKYASCGYWAHLSEFEDQVRVVNGIERVPDYPVEYRGCTTIGTESVPTATTSNPSGYDGCQARGWIWQDGYCYNPGAQANCQVRGGTFKFVKENSEGECVMPTGTVQQISSGDVNCKSSYGGTGVWSGNFCYDGRAQGNCENISGCTFHFVKGDADGSCICSGIQSLQNRLEELEESEVLVKGDVYNMQAQKECEQKGCLFEYKEGYPDGTCSCKDDNKEKELSYITPAEIRKNKSTNNLRLLKKDLDIPTFYSKIFASLFDVAIANKLNKDEPIVLASGDPKETNGGKCPERTGKGLQEDGWVNDWLDVTCKECDYGDNSSDTCYGPQDGWLFAGLWKPQTCGDGSVQTDEACDDGESLETGTCNSTCSASTYCGDGTVQSPNGQGTGGPNNDGVEECDDGAGGSDECTADCVRTNTADWQEVVPD